MTESKLVTNSNVSFQVQFIAILVHSFQLLFRDCDYPIAFVYWIGSHAILFWFLFWDFFKKTYLEKRAAKAAANGSLNGVVKNGSVKSNGSAQFACSPTETLLHLMNKEFSEDGHTVKSNGSFNGSTKTSPAKNGLTSNGVPNGVNGKTSLKKCD